MACSGNEEMKQSYSKQIMLNGPFSKKVAKDYNLKKKWPKIIITLSITTPIVSALKNYYI
jgi:hypothetical protein